MRMRPIVPGGRGTLLILAFAAVPIVLSRCKPLAKQVGERLVKWGESLQKEAEKPETSEPAQAAETEAPKPEVQSAQAEPEEKPAAAKKVSPKPKPKAAASGKPKAAAKPNSSGK